MHRFLAPLFLVLLFPLAGFDCDTTLASHNYSLREGYLRIAAPAVTLLYCKDDYPKRVVYLARTRDNDSGVVSETPGDSAVTIAVPGAREISVLVANGDCFHGTQAVSLAVQWCGELSCQPLYLLSGIDWPFSLDLYPYVAPGAL